MPIKKYPSQVVRILAWTSVLGLGVTLSFASTALAAFNDVTLTTSAIVSIGGASLNISGSNAVVQSIVAGTNSFDVTLLSGSSFAVSSASGRGFTTSISGTAPTVTVSCGSTSILTLTPTGTATVTVTPVASCTVLPVVATTVSGGGGSGYVLSPALRTNAKPDTITRTSTQLVPTAKINFSITKNLKFGMKHKDVGTLQELLARDASIYPEGILSGYFGVMTRKAVQRFQEKYKIAGMKDAGYGMVGPKTKAKLQELFGN